MRRKQISHRLKSIAEVRAALGAHRETITTELDARLPQTEGETFSYRSQFDHMIEELARVETEMITREDQHLRLQVRIAKKRTKYEELTGTLYNKQVAARRVLGGLFGPENGFTLAATSGATPRDVQILAGQVDQSLKLLRNPEDPMPEVKIAGVTLDFTAMADDLEGTLAVLRASFANHERLKKEADATRARTNAAITECNRVLPLVANSLESAFRLAGETELADRIRTSKHRVTRRQGDAEETGEAASQEETAPSGDAATLLAEDTAGSSAHDTATLAPAATVEASNDS
ncbi:MAG: hypothetical protein AAF560_24470 [Acidobacteriota bacterium]